MIDYTTYTDKQLRNAIRYHYQWRSHSSELAVKAARRELRNRRTPLSDLQREVMNLLGVGEIVDVGTSQYLGTKQTNFFSPTIVAPPSTFRGLEARGLIKINSTSWRCMNITCLKEAPE